MMKLDKYSVRPTIGRTTLATALALCLGVLPLAACGSKPADDANPSGIGQSDGTDAAPVDIASWKTLGDALATRTGSVSYGFDDHYFVAVFDAGEQTIRTISKSDPGMNEKLYALDYGDSDYDKKLNEALADLELLSAEDITPELISQEELDSYVGKTGQDMFDAGYVFNTYYFYGGEQTGASLDHGSFSYEVTFDKSITEEQTDDEGESLKDATIVEIQSLKNLSNKAIDPSQIELDEA